MSRQNQNPQLNVNIGILRPPSFGHSDNNFLSFSERAISPVIAGINSIRRILWIFGKNFEMFIVLMM